MAKAAQIEADIISWILSYAPLAAVFVAYLWNVRVTGRWFFRANFFFGLPLTSVLFGAILVAGCKSLLANPVFSFRPLMCLICLTLWGGLFWLQTLFRRQFQNHHNARVETLVLCWVSNLLGAFAYTILRWLLYTLGL
jgi:hypothetical protein